MMIVVTAVFQNYYLIRYIPNISTFNDCTIICVYNVIQLFLYGVQSAR